MRTYFKSMCVCVCEKWIKYFQRLIEKCKRIIVVKCLNKILVLYDFVFYKISYVISVILYLITHIDIFILLYLYKVIWYFFYLN